jgi:hypothetical protein
MRCSCVSLIVLAILCQAAVGQAAEPAKLPPYKFTINGLPFAPRVFSLRGDPDNPQPGDLIALGTLLLTLGPERDCHFIIKPERKDRKQFGRVFLRLVDGRERVVGVRVLSIHIGDKSHIVSPLDDLSADEIRGLWGVCIEAWSGNVAERLRQIDPARTCISAAGDALRQEGGKNAFPPLREDIQYLNMQRWGGGDENGEPLRQWAQLRFLRIEGCRDRTFDARWLAYNRSLCRLDLNDYSIEHPEALSKLDRLECLDLSGILNLATIGFVDKLTRLRSLNVANTAIWSTDYRESKSLRDLNVSRTKVRDLSSIAAKNLEELDVSETMVRDLSPLWKLKKLKTVTATNSTVEKLPRRPMPWLQRLIVYSTPLSQASIDAFSTLNPECAVMRGWADALRRGTAKATRLRIRSGGMGCFDWYALSPFLYPEKTLFEITDPARIREFVGLVEIDEKGSNDGCWDGCCLEHGPTFEFYQKDKLVTTVGCTNIGLCWSRNWPMFNARLTRKSLDRMTKWLAAHGCSDPFDAIKHELTAEKAESEQRAAIAECYPERVRQFFDPPDDENDEDDEDAQGPGETSQPCGEPAKLAKTVGDPVELAIITCRAMGAFRTDCCWEGTRDFYLVYNACRGVSSKDFVKALERIRGDRQGELGAGRLLFQEHERERYREKVPQPQELDWMLFLAPVLLNHGESDDVLYEFFEGEYATDPKVVATVRKIARGELGRDRELVDYAVGLRARIYLELAKQKTTDIRPEVEELLNKTTRRQDVAALEVALALLGDAKRLKPEHLNCYAPVDSGAFRAIERCNGREGLNILVEAGLGNPDDSVQERSLLLLQKIAGQRWYDEKKDREYDRHLGKNERLDQSIAKARQWWREHGADFVARRRAEKRSTATGNRQP